MPAPTGALRLAGDTSWGDGCARPGKPGVYGRLGDSTLREWIRANAPGAVAPDASAPAPAAKRKKATTSRAARSRRVSRRAQRARAASR